MTDRTEPHAYTDRRGRNLCDRCDRWKGSPLHIAADPTAPLPDDELAATLHREKWACSEDRDSCDPVGNPAFHAAQLASIGLPSGTGSSGSGSTSASAALSGSLSGALGADFDHLTWAVDAAIQRGESVGKYHHSVIARLLAALRAERAAPLDVDAQFEALDKSLLMTFQWSDKEYREKYALTAHALLQRLHEIGWTVAALAPATGEGAERE